MNTNTCFHIHSDHCKWDTKVMEHHNKILKNSFVSMKVSLIVTKACSCTFFLKVYFKKFSISPVNVQGIIIKSMEKLVVQ